jgi:hypothetical protein
VAEGIKGGYLVLFSLDLQPEKLYNAVNNKITRKEAKMKTLTLIFGCLLLLVIPSQAAEQNQADRNGQFNIQEERLQDICDTASRQRQDIENRYLADLTQLKQQALQKARRIRLFDRMLWTEFISESYQKPYADNYIYKSPPLCYNLKVYKLRGVMIDSYFLNMAADFLMDADARKLLADIVNINRDTPRDNRNFSFQREAQELLAVMDYFAALSERLENQKANELTDLQIWEESSMAEVQRAIREIVSPAEATPYGTVIAVIYYNKGSFCMIEGLDDEIIKPGDTINNAQIKNVRIVKIDIDRARVEFDGNGRQWTQTVGQSPNPGWE